MSNSNLKLFKNGHIHLMNTDREVVESMVISGNKILAYGSWDKTQAFKQTNCEIIDLQGNHVYPGFIDSHTHLSAAGFYMQKTVDLDSVTSKDQMLNSLKKRADKTPLGNWVIGFNYDESVWLEAEYFDGRDLDNSISSAHPIIIKRVDGHKAIVNKMAFDKFQIDPSTEGVLLDEEGKPNGILIDVTFDVTITYPPLDEMIEVIKKACYHANSLGITAVNDMLSSSFIPAYFIANQQNKLSVRVTMNYPVSKIDSLKELDMQSPFGSDMLQFGGVKMFLDGSIGAFSAWVSEPYEGTDELGMSLISDDEFYSIIKKAVKNELQTSIHAIGDVAIEQIVKTFERLQEEGVSGKYRPIKEQRHRIEHAEILTDDLLERIKKLGLILSMQPNFPGRWGNKGQLYDQRFGKKYLTFNPFREILEKGIQLVFGSDGMPLSPLYGIHSVVNHEIPNIKMTMDEALAHYTCESAKSSFLEKKIGSLERGKFADFIVLTVNLEEVTPDEIDKIEVLQTFLGGKLVYSK
ncbi:MAG: amidohydrolase [Candidatus Kariarchaeaceae archaeon]